MGDKKMSIPGIEHTAEYQIKFCIWKKVLELSVKGPITLTNYVYSVKMFTLRCIELDLFDAFDPIALFFGDKK